LLDDSPFVVPAASLNRKRAKEMVRVAEAAALDWDLLAGYLWLLTRSAAAPGGKEIAS